MKYVLFYSMRVVMAILTVPVAAFGFFLGALWEFKFCPKHFACFYQVTYLPFNYGNSDRGKWHFPKWMHDQCGNSSFKYTNPISWALKTKNYFSLDEVHFSSEY